MQLSPIDSNSGHNHLDNGILRLNQKDRSGLSQRSSQQVDFIIRTLEIDASDAVFDLGCGIGRHLLEFAKRGYKNFRGVDINPHSVAQAKKSLKSFKLDHQISVGDFSETDFICKFAYSYFGAFSYGFERDIVRDLRIIFERLENHGGICLDLINRDFFDSKKPLYRWLYEPGEAILEVAELCCRTSVLTTKRKYVSTALGEKDFYYAQRTFTVPEITDLLHAIGFVDVSCVANETGMPVNQDSQRIIVSAFRR